MPEKMWRPAQLATELQVSSKTINRWIAEGRIIHERTFGGSIGRGHARIPNSEVNRIKLLFKTMGRASLDDASGPEPEPTTTSTTPAPAQGLNGSGP